MPNIRIKDIPTTASATSSTDFIAIDGATNGTRKLSADSPVFSGNVTVNGGTVGTAASTNLTLAGGSSGASLVLGQGANGDASMSPAGTGLVLIPKGAAGATRTFLRLDETGTASNSSQQILARNTAQSWDQGAIRFTRDAANNDFHIDLVPATSGALNTTNIARLTDTGNLLIGGTTDITGSGGLKVFGTTASTSTTTGALQVAGGVGVAGALFTGGNVTVNGGTVGTAASTNLTLAGGSTGANLLLEQGANGRAVLSSKGTGITNIVGQPATAAFGEANATFAFKGNQGPGNIYLSGGFGESPFFGYLQTQRINTGPSGYLVLQPSAGNLLIGGTTDITGSGGLKVFGTTASTSTTTGALQVAGGVGVAGAAFFGGAIAIGNTVNTVTATLPNRTITMVIGGTTYYIHAKTTND